MMGRGHHEPMGTGIPLQSAVAQVRAVMLTVLLSSCSEPRGDGREVVTRICAHFSDPTVNVILLDPEECTTCNEGIRSLLDRHRQEGRSWRLMLTRSPTAFESRQLRLARLRPEPYSGSIDELQQARIAGGMVVRCGVGT